MVDQIRFQFESHSKKDLGRIEDFQSELKNGASGLLGPAGASCGFLVPPGTSWGFPELAGTFWSGVWPPDAFWGLLGSQACFFRFYTLPKNINFQKVV